MEGGFEESLNRVALAPRGVASWPTFVAAGLLSLVLAAALYEGSTGERSSALPGVRSHGVSHKKEGLSSLPVAAQGPVSAALGAASPAYRIRASGRGFAAASPGQHLGARFRDSGVSVSSGSTHVGLSVGAMGYGNSLSALGEVSPRARGNRVLYARRDLSEWYVNGPIGLEQGFTVRSAPSGRPAGALTLSMALSGNARAALGAGRRSITFSRAGRPVLRYSGLSATDARGRALHSWLELQGGRMLLRVDTRHAHYPLRIDPFVEQGAKLTAKEETGSGLFGYSAALSSSGEYALIGGPANSSKAGAAWVFTRSGSTWTQQAKLTGKEETGEGEFGFSVAIAANGESALIGGPGNNKNAGAAWVFTRNEKTWTQQAKLTGKEETGEGEFGWSVALSSKEANTALIGGPNDNTNVGAAWVFTRAEKTWTQQGAKLTGKEESGEGHFGYSVTLSSEGNTGLIGGVGDKAFTGAAWAFTRSGSTWAQQGAKLTGAEESGAAQFGTSVGLSSEGNTALIGGPGDNLDVGAAWVFARAGSTWTQQAKLTGNEESGEGEFGFSVGLSSDGATALIGGPADNNNIGAAWFLTHSGPTWTQQGAKLTGKEESGEGGFGFSVALSSEGNIGFIGGVTDNKEVGAAWAFVNTAPAVETRAASAVTQTSASLNATVNPDGGEVSKCEFEYGTTTSYGSTVTCTPPSPGSGNSPVAVTAALPALTVGTTYHFRISATNAGGISQGSDETFTTRCTTEDFCTSFTPEGIEGSLKEPAAVAVEPSGNMWVADSGHDRMLEFNSERRFLRQFGAEGSGEGQFEGIQGVAINSSGDVYVTGSARVQEFSPTGTFIRKFGSPGAGNGQFAGPSGIAVDSAGNVWVLDSFNYRVQEFSATGEYVGQFGTKGTGSGQLGWAFGLAISGGHLYVSEFANSRVQEFSTSGEVIRQFGSSGSGNGQLHGPWGIASSPITGRLYVADTANNRIEEFSPEGSFVTAFGSAGHGGGQFSGPKGVAVSPSGIVYVTDTGNERVQEWVGGQ
jgi:hypothetical protein